MADSLIVFDPNVFDVAVFDALEIVPTVERLYVPRPMRFPEFGQTVPIFAYLYDYETIPGHAFPVSPMNAPQIEVYDPLDTISVPFTDMIYQDRGVYLYQYELPSFSYYGAYAARVTTTNGSQYAITKKHIVFTVR